MNNDQLFTDTELLDFANRNFITLAANLYGYKWVLIDEDGDAQVKGNNIRVVI